MSGRSGKTRRARFRFRLTLAGWVFLTITVLLGIAAVKSQVALMFLVFGGLVGVVYVSGVVSRWMVRAVRVERVAGQRAWQYATVPLGYQLRNTHKRGASLSLVLAETSSEGIESVDGFCAHLPAGEVFRAGGRFWARDRGRITLRGLLLSTTFPFGLVQAARETFEETSIVIWPARGRLRVPLLRHGAVESSSAAPSQATGGQDEFFGLREYRPGDNPRWIHWRRSAVRAAPVVREMTRPLPEVLWVIVDTLVVPASAARAAGASSTPATGAAAREAFERRLRFAATLVDDAFARGYQVGLSLAYADRVVTHPPQAGRSQRQVLLDALAEADENTTIGLEQTVAAIGRAQVRQAQVVLAVADRARLDRAPLGALRATSRHLTAVCDRDLRRIFHDPPSPPPPEAC